MNVLLDRNRPSAEFPETLERNAGRAPSVYRRSRVGAGSAGERGRHVCVPPTTFLYISVHRLIPKPRSDGCCSVCSASQEERINMLNVALIEKGVIASGSHYELKQTPVTDAQQSPALRLDPLMDELNEDNEGGVVL